MYRTRIVRQAATALSRADTAAVIQLVHPDAIITVRSSPLPLRGRRALARHVEQFSQRISDLAISSIEQIGDDGLLVEGRKRFQTEEFALIDVPSIWVVEFRDHLVWRSASYPDREEALRAAAGNN